VNSINGILIIGGSGFIGTRLVIRLRAHSEFLIGIFDKAPSKVFSNLTSICDVRSISQLRKSVARQDTIINLAGQQ